jgi:simple sugar transport system ATP-binding protein
VISTHKTEEIEAEQISELMIGRRVVYSYEELRHETKKEPILKVEHLTYQNTDGKQTLKDVSFDVCSGEIVGVVGVEGNGQRELVDLLFGYTKPLSGTVHLKDSSVLEKGIKARRDQGITYIPEDRMVQGSAADGNIRENMISSFYTIPELSGKIFMHNKRVDSLTSELVEKFDILCNGNESKIGSLSGGNIQKVVFAREAYTDGTFLIAEQPTRGVDVGSASLIHKHLLQLRNDGRAVLMISADLGEALAVCDKLLVLYSGEIVAELTDVQNITESEVGLYMLGLKKQERNEKGGSANETR